MKEILETLSNSLDPFLTALARAQEPRVQGSSATAALYQRFSVFSQPETFHRLQIAPPGETAQDARRRVLLSRFVQGHVQAALAAPAQNELSRWETSPLLEAGGQRLPARELDLTVERERKSDRRGLWQKAYGAFLSQHEPLYLQNLKAATLASERLGVTLGPSTSLCAEAVQCLVETEDAYRDLLDYVLRKTEPELRALPGGGARWHDLRHAVTAPWMASHFRREELLDASSRWLSKWGPVPSPVKLDAPQEILFGGLVDARRWLFQLGQAHRLAAISPQNPAELRWLADGALRSGLARLFAIFLSDEQWLRRVLGLSPQNAREGARLAAFEALAELRELCAELLYQRTLLERGPFEERVSEYRDRQSEALFVDVPGERFVLHAGKLQGLVETLEGFAVAHRLGAWLTEQFDRDHWNNPRARERLASLFATSAEQDAQPLLEALTGCPATLGEVTGQLTSVLNR